MSVKEEPKCEKCDSHDWQGFLRCKVCGRYFIFGRCKNCDQIRIEECPIDQGELEYIAPDESEQ